MDVVEADDQWARRGQPLEQVAERAVGAVAVGARPLANAQRRQHADQRVLVREPEARHASLAHRGQVAVERLGPERVGQVGLVLRRARLDHRAALGRRHVPQQPRLADARLALEHEQPGRTATQRGERGVDRLALARTSDQGAGST